MRELRRIQVRVLTPVRNLPDPCYRVSRQTATRSLSVCRGDCLERRQQQCGLCAATAILYRAAGDNDPLLNRPIAPTMHTDRYGLALSSPSAAACEHYVTGVDLLLSNQPGADIALNAALTLDTGFAMAHAALARHHQSWGRAADARTAIAKAHALLSAHSGGTSISPREQQHVAVLAAAIEGRATDALRLLLAHVNAYPRDALVLGLALGAFGLLAFSGRPDHDGVRLALCERLAPAYGDDWWFLGYLGWGHVEAGSLHAGERHIERSLELNGANANAMHAFAHLSYEQGRAAEAVGRLDGLTQHYELRALLHNHLRWHAALGALAAGRIDQALDVYDRFLTPAAATAPLITALSDAVSLLWRIETAGYPCGVGRWQTLSQFVKARPYQATVAFLDVHVAALYAAAGEQAAFDELLQQMEGALAAGRMPAGPGVLALCHALRAQRSGDAALCAELIEANLGQIVRLGGSGAQRDLFEDTLTAAYAHLGDKPAAERLTVWQAVRTSRAIKAIKGVE